MLTFGNFRITRPTVIIDEARARLNIEMMAAKARRSGVRFRPHFKTHRSALIGSWFRDAGVNCITVSSVEMAEYFHGHGWTDITLAFLVNYPELDRITALAGNGSLHLIADNIETIEILRRNLDKNSAVNVWIKIDTGYHRTGISDSEIQTLIDLIKLIQSSRVFNFAGILSHNGLIYQSRSRDEIISSHESFMKKMIAVRDAVGSFCIDGCKISIGDTPACTVLDRFDGIDEIRPGNFVFYDLQQRLMGVCQDADLAMSLACPIVGVYPHRNAIALYGGAVHFSKESAISSSGQIIYGRLLTGGGDLPTCIHTEDQLISLSQEHGILNATSEIIGSVSAGDILRIVPIHSCLTCHLHKRYRTHTGISIPAM